MLANTHNVASECNVPRSSWARLLFACFGRESIFRLFYYIPFSFTGVAGSGGERLFSHSFKNSTACFFTLLGVKRLSMGGSSSSSLAVVVGDGEREFRWEFDAFFVLLM